MARPRIELTSAMVASIVRVVAAGGSRAEAAAAVGVSKPQLFVWLSRGRELVASGRWEDRHDQMLRFLVGQMAEADARRVAVKASERSGVRRGHLASAARRQLP